MFVRDIKPYERVQIGNIALRLEKKSGRVVRISIDAPKDVPIRVLDSHGDSEIVPKSCGDCP